MFLQGDCCAQGLIVAFAAVRGAIAVGIDLVSVQEIDSSVRQFGRRFLERIYTPRELAYCLENPLEASKRLAARFAAKEATRKVLRIVDEGLSWQSIEIERAPEGWCEVRLHAEAATLAERAGLGELAVSLTHEKDYASAVVIGARS